MRIEELYFRVLDILKQQDPDLAEEYKKAFAPSLASVMQMAKLFKQGLLTEDEAVAVARDYHGWYMTMRAVEKA